MRARVEVTGNIVVHHPATPAAPVQGPLGDGYPHIRDLNGTCVNCGASSREYHYRLVPRPRPRRKVVHGTAKVQLRPPLVTCLCGARFDGWGSQGAFSKLSAHLREVQA